MWQRAEPELVITQGGWLTAQSVFETNQPFRTASGESGESGELRFR